MFKNQNFCHVASNNRNNVKAGLFVYRTTDDLATVIASGYFNGAIIDVKLHDLIIHEKYDASDNTKVERNLLCVTEKTLENVVTSVIKSKWEGDIEQAIADLETYVNNNFVKIDGSSTMTGPLKMRSSISFKCAIAPSWDGVGFYKLNDNDSLTLMASMETTDGLCPATNNTYNLGKTSHKWKDAYIARVITSILNNGYDIAVPVTNSADTLALKSQVDLAANSGSQLYDTGVWYAKMYAASTVPTGAEYDGTNYADFSQVDGDSSPIIVIYEGQSGAWVEIDRITPPATYNGYITVTSKIWDIAEQTDQQGGQVLWSYNSKTFTPYPRIVSVGGFARTSLDNLTDEGKNISNWSSNVTNCIINIPQDIKLELNAGVLTLKAGSKVWIPDGFEQDGTTPKFYQRTIENDIVNSAPYTNVSGKTMLFLVSSTTMRDLNIDACYSGGSEPPTTYYNRMWFDTTNNLVKEQPNGWISGRSLPIAILNSDGSNFISIDQVFNGFGYIGSTVFALPGVKGLIPDGRNADGTLKNIEFSLSTVKTSTLQYDSEQMWSFANSTGTILGDTIGSGQTIYFIKNLKNMYSLGITSGYSKCYVEETNKWYQNANTSTWTETKMCPFAHTRSSSLKITKFNSKTDFHAVDYNDTDFIAHQSMPSGTHISLTLGASGTSYMAPADGYLQLNKYAGASGEYMEFSGILNIATVASFNGQLLCMYKPVVKGEIIQINYNLTGTTSRFRFFYANGAA